MKGQSSETVEKRAFARGPSDAEAERVCLQVRDRSILMTLYGQFYSIGDDLTIADVGLVYVFVCFNDYEARAIVQSG